VKCVKSLLILTIKYIVDLIPFYAKIVLKSIIEYTILIYDKDSWYKGNSMKLKIINIFSSIQGEGLNVGQKCVFVRLQGCNKECYFCDTKEHKQEFYRFLSIERVYALIKKQPHFNISTPIILTGGEPTLQIEAINALFQKFYNEEKSNKLYLETNGSIDISKYTDIFSYIAVSPKDNDVQECYYRHAHEFKYVLNGKNCFLKIKDIKRDREKVTGFRNYNCVFYIQPENNVDSIDKINLNYCLGVVNRNPEFRLSVQLHKMIGV